MKVFEQVRNFDKDIPKAKLGWASRRWGMLLFVDFLFGFSKRKNKDGLVLKKIEGDSSINKKFRKAHQDCVDKLIANNPKGYEGALKVPEIDAKDFTKDFLKKWKNYDKTPIVIRNYLKGADILNYMTKESLVQNKGDAEVTAVSDMLEVKEKLGQNVKLADTTLGDFLTKPEFQDYYVNNLSGFLNENDFNQKCRGIELDNVHGSKNLLTQWFISRSNKTGSSLHCAGGDNIFLNILGKKEWHFIHPSYGSVLQVGVQDQGQYAFSEVHKKINDGYSGLIESNPYLKHVPIFSCVLEEGDILYNPPMWWHAVKNVTNYNVGCATRYISWTQYSAALQACMTSSIIKSPTSNPLVSGVRMAMKKRKQKQFTIPIYSKKKEVVTD